MVGTKWWKLLASPETDPAEFWFETVRKVVQAMQPVMFMLWLWQPEIFITGNCKTQTPSG